VGEVVTPRVTLKRHEALCVFRWVWVVEWPTLGRASGHAITRFGAVLAARRVMRVERRALKG
jgi:hypothetical protein